MSLLTEMPDDVVSIPPVIVSPFSFVDVLSVPYHLAQRNLEALWPISGAGEGVKVGVIDTGIDKDHPEVASSIVKVLDFTGSRKGAHDIAGHGTHVASSIAGAKTGGAPKASLYIYKALGDEGWGRSSWIAKAVEAAINDGVHIINMSLGSPTASQEIYRAIKRAHAAGIIICAATGNDSSNRNGFPADFNDVCLAVAAIDKNRRKASFSNAGQGTDVCEYGVNVVGAKTGGGFVAMSGTSMATPVCASIHANRFSYQLKYGIPYQGPAAWYQMIEQFCDDLGAAGHDGGYGFGQINALKAFGTPRTPVTPDPGLQDPAPPEDNDPEDGAGDEPVILGTIWRLKDGRISVVNVNQQAIIL